MQSQTYLIILQNDLFEFCKKEVKGSGWRIVISPVWCSLQIRNVRSTAVNIVFSLFQLEETTNANIKTKQASRCMLLESNPAVVVERFLNKIPQESMKYESGTVLAISLTNLSEFISLSSAHEAINILDELVTELDKLAAFRNVHKSPVSGGNILLTPEFHCSGLSQVRTVSSCALKIINYLEKFASKRQVSHDVQAKLAISTGPVLTGVLGQNLPVYTVLGTAVVKAFTLLNNTRPGAIQLCRSTYDLLQQLGDVFETYALQTEQKVSLFSHRTKLYDAAPFGTFESHIGLICQTIRF